MRRPFLQLLGIATVIVLIAAPVAYSFHHLRAMRNFAVVREGVLYRSGQMSLDGLKRAVHDYGIRTVVTLRDAYTPGEPAPDREEEHWCQAQEINYYRIPPRRWEGQGGEPPPVEPGVRQFREIMANPDNYPVLVHCFAGVHRTGAYCAIYRMEHDRWSNERAIAEMKRFGYGNLDEEEDILGYLEHYRPTWRKDAPPAPAKKAVGKPKRKRQLPGEAKPAWLASP